jgi:prevent-host-death family protein
MVMIKVNVFEAKARLSEYLDRVARGERILICRHNKPVAELRPLSAVRTEPRPIGPLPGRPVFDVPPSFFEPMADDEAETWEGAMPAFGPSPSSASTAARIAERRTGVGPGKRSAKQSRRS